MKKLKQAFLRFPICIVADGLYVSLKVMETCQNNTWKYLIRYKEGCASTIEKEFVETPEKEVIDEAEYANVIVYNYKDSAVNVLRYKEKRVKSGNEIETTYTWITNIEITKKMQKDISNDIQSISTT